jgi:hypothetical protein
MKREIGRGKEKGNKDRVERGRKVEKQRERVRRTNI